MGLLDTLGGKLNKNMQDPLRMGLLSYGMTGQGQDPGGTAINAMRSGNYSQERQNQMQAYGLLPSVSQAGMGVAQNLYGMGQNVHNQDANQLGILGNAVGVGMGGAGQSTTGANPNYRDPFQTALGLGALFL